MTTSAEHMLLGAMAQHANYKERRLIKAGRLGECATTLIRRRRKLLTIHYGLFMTFIALQVIVILFSTDRSDMFKILAPTNMAAMTQLPVIILTHISLSKLETIAALWLLSNPDHPATDTHVPLVDLIVPDTKPSEITGQGNREQHWETVQERLPS